MLLPTAAGYPLESNATTAVIALGRIARLCGLGQPTMASWPTSWSKGGWPRSPSTPCLLGLNTHLVHLAASFPRPGQSRQQLPLACSYSETVMLASPRLLFLQCLAVNLQRKRSGVRWSYTQITVGPLPKLWDFKASHFTSLGVSFTLSAGDNDRLVH